MRPLNLRFRLMIFFMIISVSVFTIAGIFSWRESREKVDEFFDTYQIALARQLSTADWSHIVSETQKISDELVERIDNSEDEDESIGFAVFNNEGRRIFHDGENGGDFSPFGKTGGFGTERVEDEDWRVIRLMSTDGKYIVAVGQELDFRHEIVEDMFEEFMTPWGLGLVILLLAIILMLTREFSSLNRLAQQLKTRNPDDLSALDQSGIPQEVSPLINAVNQLFQRIESMLQRERNFISDSAHELRSPLTALKVQLEVAQMSFDDPELIRQSLEKLEQGVDRSTRLVEQLLAFSRIEAGLNALPKSNDELDWKSIINQTKEECLPRLESKNLNFIIEVSGLPPFRNGNAVWAALMMRNLVDNAVKYTPENATIKVTVGNKEIKVCNSDTIVDPEDLVHFGQRFYRPAGQKIEGSGLGLSIVNKIASIYNCRTEYANTKEGFCVTIYASGGKECNRSAITGVSA